MPPGHEPRHRRDPGAPECIRSGPGLHAGGTLSFAEPPAISRGEHGISGDDVETGFIAERIVRHDQRSARCLTAGLGKTAAIWMSAIGPLLSQLLSTFVALACRWRGRPQHH